MDQIVNTMTPICQSFASFWSAHPALLYGLSFLLGTYPIINFSWILVIPCLCLWIPFLIMKHDNTSLNSLYLSLMVFCVAWIYTAAFCPFPTIPSGGLRGTAHLQIKNVSLQQTFFGSSWIYRCEIDDFFVQGKRVKGFSYLPCTVKIPLLSARPEANQNYEVEGRVIQTENGSYVLKVASKTPWVPIPNTWSAAEWRYQAKQKVNRWIESRLSHPLTAAFIGGLATGEFDDAWMRQQFARFGLQHLLAISGFHFAITACVLGLILRLFLPRKTALIALLLCLFVYFFFLGPQASILRSWIMCTLALLGLLVEKQSTALNSLGIALLGVLVFDPLLSQSLGFQLSFTTTAAILLFYEPAQRWFDQLLPKRRLNVVIEMPTGSQYAYLLLTFLRSGFALTVAVNVFALPLTLYYFKAFPLMSVIYNLFYPFLTSLSMSLLIAGGLLSFVPYLSDGIHGFNNFYTDLLLRLTYQIPSQVDSYWTIETPFPLGVVVYLCATTLLGIWWKMTWGSNDNEAFSYL